MSQTPKNRVWAKFRQYRSADGEIQLELARYFTSPRKPKSDFFDCDDVIEFAEAESSRWHELMAILPPQGNLPKVLTAAKRSLRLQRPELVLS